MASAASWLGRFFTAMIVQSNGVAMTARGALNFLGLSLTDDPTNDRINVAIVPIVLASTGSLAVLQSSGDVHVSVSGLVADATITAPANPTPGMKITISIDDTSLSLHHVIFNANSKTVKGPDTSAGTHTITKEEWGTGTVVGPSLTYFFNGTFWKAPE